jgi:hypothetical protein
MCAKHVQFAVVHTLLSERANENPHKEARTLALAQTECQSSVMTEPRPPLNRPQAPRLGRGAKCDRMSTLPLPSPSR